MKVSVDNFKDVIAKSSLSQLLGDVLLDRSNSIVMMRYVSSTENLKILMGLLKVSIFWFGIFLCHHECRVLWA